MSKTAAKIRMLRSVLFGGRAYSRDEIATVSLEDALTCVEMQRAVFIDADDRERALEVRRDAIRKMLQAGNPWLQAGASGAWQRTH
ncbi:MAG: hypothetical protein ACLGIT_12425 [Gammaproteobacteria bacterium]